MNIFVEPKFSYYFNNRFNEKLSNNTGYYEKSGPHTVVPERKFAKIQSIVFYGLDGYFWTLITTSNTKNPNLNSKTSFFEKDRWVIHNAWAFYKVT